MSQDPNQPNKSGGMSTLMIVLIVLGVLFLLCAGLCGGCIVIGRQAANAVGKAATQIAELAEPAGAAQSQISSAQVVKDKFGDFVTFGLPGRDGNTEGELNTADAHFKFEVMGNNQTGTAHMKAARVDGLWKINEIKIKCTDGTEIDVPVSEDAAPPDLKFEDGTEEMPEDKK